MKQANDDTRKLKLLPPEALKSLKDELNKINQTPDATNKKLARKASEPSFESAFTLFMKQTTFVDEKEDVSIRVLGHEN